MTTPMKITEQQPAHRDHQCGQHRVILDRFDEVLPNLHRVGQQQPIILREVSGPEMPKGQECDKEDRGVDETVSSKLLGGLRVFPRGAI